MIVVDCSVIVDALIGPDDETTSLRSLLSSDNLVAPGLLDYEVVSALRGVTRAGRLSQAGAADALADFDDLSIARWNLFDGFRRRAYELSAGISSYDAAYVVLAEALDAPLLTRDRKLAKAAKAFVTVTVA